MLLTRKLCSSNALHFVPTANRLMQCVTSVSDVKFEASIYLGIEVIKELKINRALYTNEVHRHHIFTAIIKCAYP